MSYCRFSSNCYQSDAYVYQSDYGYQIHLASNRRASPHPRPTPKETDPESILRYWQDCSEWYDLSTSEPITLPEAGESFEYRTPGECADKLIELQKLGYHIPKFAIDTLLLEEADCNSDNEPFDAFLLAERLDDS